MAFSFGHKAQLHHCDDRAFSQWQCCEMINLAAIIERIEALLSDDTDASVTYAALEARLALEKVCYDRLRQRHDYISHDQLKRWQPGAVVLTLMNEVDAHVGQTMTLKMGKNPGVKPEDDDYVEIGTEVGFDPKRVAKMWQALANLALHVRLPEHRNDNIPAYGDKVRTRAKVEEVVAELKRLSKGTMTFSGFGEEVHFECSCGEKNRRRAGLLRDGQYVHCINPNCKQTWKAVQESDGFGFEQVTVPVDCDQCGKANHLPWRFFLDMKHDELGSFSCHTCKHKNFVQWRLMQARREPPVGGVGSG
ncbi:hypothetical protein [Aurantiacibacter poecillastricola]|uniref:hypothetical protein n=1 Tax=Aurantiacibacter poecillastricola TaxID=3064385 RepID=UPI00273E1819|nr:hypothetical protein [Aurantiacibacter sp. 219JJ12-13]MDP5263014.1 hypothetical protein [Aurantiacibacter sp. 219JJ12-13]